MSKVKANKVLFIKVQKAASGNRMDMTQKVRIPNPSAPAKYSNISREEHIKRLLEE